MFRISSKKPVPVRTERRLQGRKSEFAKTLGKLEVGQSFHVPREDGGMDTTVRSASYQYGSRHGKKYTTKVENGGVRVWRIQ